MIKMWRRRNSCFCRLIIGCLLFSILSMGIPTWAQSGGNGRDFLADKSDEVVIVEDNPGLGLIILTIVAIVTQIATTVWAAQREEEKPRPDPERIERFTKELEGLQLELETQLNEFKSKLEGKIDDTKEELNKKIGERKEVDGNQSNEIASLKAKVEQVIPKVWEILPKLEEALDKAEKLILQMEHEIERFDVVEKELRGEIEFLKETDGRQLNMVEGLRGELNEFRTETVPQEIEDTKKTLRAELNEEVKSLKTVDGQQITRIENLERRRIEFGLGAGGWLSQSSNRVIAAYEGQILIGPNVTVFGGGGSDDSWISYYGIKYTFANILNLGIGRLNSSVFEQTELMYLGGFSLDIGKARINVDYFYVPGEEDASGTRACIAFRF